jgi:geranylgeranyl pyrophosphate synthase
MSLPSDHNDALAILKADSQLLNGYFQKLRARYPQAPAQLLEAVEYSLLAGGKRLRPALVLEAARACGLPEGDPSALAAAAAIELVHTFSLVHDDLPAMDDDDLRRGRPTCHKVYGQAMAILAGDAMTMVAFELLATDADARVAPALVRELAAASGPEGMIGGQVLDLAAENTALSIEQLRQVHARKTGALLRAACRMGAIAAGAAPGVLAAISAFGQHLGVAFQIVDDLLDVTGDARQLGKNTQKDAARGKNTYPALLGIPASRQQADRELALAIDALAALPGPTQNLRCIANFVVQRQT